MKIRALQNFAGKISMSKGQEMEIEKDDIVLDLLACGYVEDVSAPPTKAVKKKQVSL